jgi:hypothetical protein
MLFNDLLQDLMSHIIFIFELHNRHDFHQI